MKGPLVFFIIVLTAIVMASSFGLQLLPHPALTVPANMVGHELYVCHAADPTWNSVAAALRPFGRYIIIGFFSVVMVVMFSWAWALYQNLLTDKFKRESFSNTWAFTKFVFWAGIIILIAMATPNHFKTVHIRGADGDWVLCERDTPGAAAVKANAVTL